MMANRCNGIIDRKFQERFKMIEDELIKPRSKLKHEVAGGKANYDFSKELFSTRRKDFWQLHTAQKVLDKVITNLTHESDGLIFQSYDDPYVSGTCNELLKWKFASHNSVDFKLKMEGGQPVLYLRSSNRGHRGDVPLQGGRIVFADGEDPSDFHMKIVECRYLKDEDAWEYMRTRTDKDTANAYHVYEKVLKSIHDNITQEVLLNHVEQVVNTSPLYSSEKADMRKRQQSAGHHR
ncbi:mRNA-capping enzyme-like [Convolutriloba macropyga]|uniref:mRNA-capping enzyme-like n=1 Tax=Convolutriloba macropyga TaxID=536237 RepID=UPI003F51D04B